MGFAGGAGSADDPYLIATPRQLDAVREHPGAHFRQIADLDMDGYGDEEAGWLPIGHFRGWLDFEPFTGSYDGNGHTIANLTIDRAGSENVGLFGYVDEGAVIVNVTLAGVDVRGGRSTGALVGYNADGSITGNHAAGRVFGTQDIGGLVGSNIGTVERCRADVDVAGSGMSVGGLVGSNNGGTIRESHATGKVASDDDQVGGLAGLNAGGTIVDSSATGAVSGERGIAGGLVGGCSGTIRGSHATGNVTARGEGAGGLIGVLFGTVTNHIEDCHATGDVAGTNFVGGLIGRSIMPNINIGNRTSVTRCYATGTVRGTESVGGLIGESEGAAVRLSYAVGDVTGHTEVGGLIGRGMRRSGIRSVYVITDSYSIANVTGHSFVGGIVGRITEWQSAQYIGYSYASGRVAGESRAGALVGDGRLIEGSPIAEYSYYDADTTTQNDRHGGAGKTTAEMMLRKTFEGWDFEETWAIEEGEGYPLLLWQTESDP